MARKAELSLTGRQRDQDGEESVTESRMTADYYEKDGSSYILYEETHCSVSFSVSDAVGSSNIIRSAPVCSVLAITKSCWYAADNSLTFRRGSMDSSNCPKRALASLYILSQSTIPFFLIWLPRKIFSATVSSCARFNS